MALRAFQLLLLSGALGAATWAPLPPEAWAIKEDPALGIRDAAVLEKRVRFNSAFSEYFYRIRVLSEAGRQAVHIPAPTAAYDFEGRTVQRDGQEVVFNSAKDCTTRTISARSGFERKQTVLIPPGMTSDCVVELRFKRSGDTPYSPLPPGERMQELDLASPYFTVHSQVEVPTNFPWVWTVSADRHAPTVTQEGLFKVVAFTNLPAQGAEAFVVGSAEGLPRMTTFFMPGWTASFLKKPVAEFWSQGIGPYIKDYFESDPSIGRAFKDFAAEVTQGLEGNSTQEKAARIYTRLQEKWKNIDHLTWEEYGARPKEYAQGRRDSSDLDQAARRKETDSAGMTIALYQLLKRAGLSPVVGAVADRGLRLFSPEIRNLYQLNGTILGVPVPGQGTIWMDASMRFANPGLIHPAFQGTPGLLFDSATWSPRNFSVPVQPADMNRSSYEYWITPGDVEDGLVVKTAFTGFPAHARRLDYLAMEPREQDRILRETTEKAIGGINVKQAKVVNVTDGKRPFGWELEGAIAREGSRRRTVALFPGMPLPLEIPRSLPEARTSSIFLPYLQVQTAVSHVLVPAGYKAVAFDPVERKTWFGSTTLTAASAPKGDLNELTVTLKIMVTQFSATPTGYGELKRFLAAIQEVAGTTVVLERLP